ncbi:hypothetical protein [Haloferula sp. A504]|uniref:hypothetical protein n=1 Tax=Haloferula sp. A504 TaxID=3373601 RepID=UPI0031CBE978|nr:hypothetical protein [Verrucomicrobiaceae bacterium E54]
MRLYVDLETLQLIEGPGFRNPVTSLRFKRGDAAKLEVAFLTAGTTPTEIGDPATLEIRFGAKPRARYDVGYLVHTSDWTLPEAGAVDPSYVCSPSFNTAELDAAMQVGSPTGSELSEITLMGEITWREGSGDPTSTRTFLVIVENDVNRGTEGAPVELPTPDDDWVAHGHVQTLTPTQQAQARENIGIPIDKLDGTTAPAAGNDETEGYAIGSLWIDTASGEAYRCVDASEGAAVWIESTLDAAEVGALISAAISGIGLHAVATSGNYNDLANGPWSYASGVGEWDANAAIRMGSYFIFLGSGNQHAIWDSSGNLSIDSNNQLSLNAFGGSIYMGSDVDCNGYSIGNVYQAGVGYLNDDGGTPMLDYYRTLYDEYGNTAIYFSSYAIEFGNEVALNGYTLWIGYAYSDGWLYFNGSAVELGSYGDIALNTSYAFNLSSVGGGIVATDGNPGANFTGAVSSITVVDGIVTAAS